MFKKTPLTIIAPHGGKLINRILPTSQRKKLKISLDQYERLRLNTEQIKDVKNIAIGTYSPLTGFLRKDDFENVLSRMRLRNKIIWPIPITLDVTKRDYQRLKKRKVILLESYLGNPIAFLKNIEFYKYNKNIFAQSVFQTTDKNHPGVAEIYAMEKYLVGGDVWLLDNSKDATPFNLSPCDTRKLFRKKGWKTITGFQTRNAPHCSHEHLQKQALKTTDGLFIQPAIGRKKVGDLKDDLIIKSYQLLIKKYYQKQKTTFGILPLKMRYAGPKEALFHAIIRKNFGCTHFIVGRDHAGLEDYYGPYDAHRIFDQFSSKEIGIIILKYPTVKYCKKCKDLVFENTYCHAETNKISLSATKMRKMIKNAEKPPTWFMRPVISRLLLEHSSPFIEYEN